MGDNIHKHYTERKLVPLTLSNKLHASFHVSNDRSQGTKSCHKYASHPDNTTATHLSTAKGKTKMSRLGSSDRVHGKTSGLVGSTGEGSNVDTGSRLHAHRGGGDRTSPARIHGSAETGGSSLLSELIGTEPESDKGLSE